MFSTDCEGGKKAEIRISSEQLKEIVFMVKEKG